MKTYKEIGIVIRKRSLISADEIITVCTREHGKIDVLAKGIKKIKSKLRSSLDVFNVVKVEVYQGRTFDRIIQSSILKTYPFIKHCLKNLSYGYMFLEITNKILPLNEINKDVFCLLEYYLESINKPSLTCRKLNVLFADFVGKIFRKLGYTLRQKQNIKYNSFCSIEEYAGGLVSEHLKKNIKSMEVVKKIFYS